VRDHLENEEMLLADRPDTLADLDPDTSTACFRGWVVGGWSLVERAGQYQGGTDNLPERSGHSFDVLSCRGVTQLRKPAAGGLPEALHARKLGLW
jgi:hypothetical protein